MRRSAAIIAILAAGAVSVAPAGAGPAQDEPSPGPLVRSAGGLGILPPTASLSASPNPAPSLTSVSFDGSRSGDLDGTITRYQWDLDGDGTLETDTGSISSTSRVYTRPGQVRVTLRVTDNDGMTDDEALTVTVENRAPAAAIAFSPDPGVRDEPVTADGSGSRDPDGTLVRHQWDLDGDGTLETDTGSAPSVARTYPFVGTVRVRLRVTDDSGATADATRVLTVNPPPPPRPSPDNLAPVASLALSPVQRSNVVLERGLIPLLSCSEACEAGTALTLPASQANRLGLTDGEDPVVLGRASARLSAPGRVNMPIALSSAASRALAQAGTLELSLESVAFDAARNLRSFANKLTLVDVPAGAAVVGISDQTPATFTEPLFRGLDVRHARLVVPWDAVYRAPQRLAAWLGQARAAGIEPLVAFNHSDSNHCPARPCRAPSVRAYARAFRTFHRRYPYVDVISPWNEANHQSQPIAKKPRLAASYYNVVRSQCPKCRIVALDVLDSTNLPSYLRTFKRHARGRPRLWGLHNYSDTNRFRTRGVKAMLRLVRGEVWLTETGGIHRFQTPDGRLALPPDERRAARAMSFLFTIQRRYSRRLRRVYVYQWKINFPGDRFDAGVVDGSGRPRPSYEVLKRSLPTVQFGQARRSAAIGPR